MSNSRLQCKVKKEQFLLFPDNALVELFDGRLLELVGRCLFSSDVRAPCLPLGD
jgi:hypothetical protein